MSREYDLAVGVDPSNKNRVIVGGITVWEWEQGQGWNQVNGFGPYNIHSDNHDVVWHPTDSSKVYIVNDGGVYFSNNGGDTWQTLNKNYVTTQFYDIGISADRYVVGGTQDNGSWVMDGLGNTPNEGRSLGAVDGFSGDGGILRYHGWFLRFILRNTNKVELAAVRTKVSRLLPSGTTELVKQ